MFFPDNTYYFIAAFGRTANSLTALYGAPVYLVGSSLYKENPFDIDLRVPLEEEDFLRRFGHPEKNLDYNFTWAQDWLRYYDQIKQTRRLCRQFNHHYRFDFQIQRKAIFEAHEGPRLRIDSAPDWFFEAGKGEP